MSAHAGGGADARTLSPAQQQLLLASRIGYLATADREGEPSLIPCCFTVHDDEIVTAIDEKPKGVSGPRLRRIRNIQENPRVTLVVDRYDEDWSKIGYLLVRGTAQIVETGGERPAALAALRAKYRQYGSMYLEDKPLIVITPRRATGWGVYRV